MKHLIIALTAVWGLFQIAELIWPSKGQFQGQSLAQLTEPPLHRLTEPYRNAYFYLLGFTASPSSDPAKVGYEIWVEAHEAPGARAFAHDKPGRSELHIPLSLREVFPSWDSDDPFNFFRSKDSALRTAVARHHHLLARYDRCLDMPFEDWGFGLRAIPRYDDVMIAHRLYIADGFSRSTGHALDRLSKELVFWRTALREAATISTKVIAQVVIQDDANLISRMLSRPSVDRTMLATALQLMVPLTPSEYSLRWPIQHQLAITSRDERPRTQHEAASDEPDDRERWLTRSAHLHPDAFKKIEHPTTPSFLGVPLSGRQTAEAYAAYYEALIKTSGTGGGSLPKLREVMRSMRRGFVESLLNPLPFEPEWDTFRYQLMETDTRLRLASLQVQLRRPSATSDVPTRLAEVGSHYFDPFTGLPMLWSPTQQKLYSVGKDRLDDGGDPSFDISVPTIVASAQHFLPPRSSSSATMRKPSRL